ncbi:MAG: glutamyl-tRNA reductase [Lachnospiraceae bacterium]
MIGIDHSLAEVTIRECFAFTKKAMASVMEIMKKNKNIKGCVILSTCNRMELWLSLEEGVELDLDLLSYLCEWKKLDCAEYGKYFKVRDGVDAVRHLFYLSAGIKSKIIGEDQILTQIKEAIAFSREWECADHVLEVLFRMAITAGKQVKTRIPMDRGNFSAAHQAVCELKKQGIVFSGKKALVIGNGEMGKITAQVLLEEGVEVTVTIRQYRSGMVTIPQGVKRINYGERYHYIPDCDFVFSATASPNQTITKEQLQQSRIKSSHLKQQIYVDLAVPRDIESSIQELAGIQLCDIDTFGIAYQSEKMKEQYHQAKIQLEKGILEFSDWQESRELVPRIQKIGRQSSKELCWRMEKTWKELELSEIDKCSLENQLSETTEKIVDKLIFALRDHMDADMLKQCIEIMEQVY